MKSFRNSPPAACDAVIDRPDGLKLATMIWAAGKGFDITDEGFYMLSYKYPDDIRHTLSYYHLIVSRLFFFLDVNVVNYRIARIIVELSSITMLTYGFYKWLVRGLKSSDIRGAFPLLLFALLRSFLSLFSRGGNI